MLKEQSIDWILQSATDAMLIADGRGCIVLANPPAEALFGYAPGELHGTSVDALLPQGLQEAHARWRQTFGEKPRARAMGSDMELYARCRSGREFPVEVSLSPLETVSGETLVMATVHDISRRKQAEAALQESEARMRAIFDTAVDAIVTIDEHGGIDRFNAAAENLFGYREDEVQGKNISLLMPSPYRESHDNYLKSYRDTGERKIIGIGREVIGQRRDGSTFPIELSVAEMRFGDRRMFTGMIRDISARKQAEQALQQSQLELRRLSAHQEQVKEQERKRIAQEIHDELGAVLTGIKAYVSVSIDRAVRAGLPADPLLVETASMTETAIHTVRRVITDLRPSVLDHLGVWDALEWYAGQIEERARLACLCAFDDTVLNAQLDAERSTMVFRIVQEALTNVVRHAEASTVWLKARCEDEDIVVQVEDNGKGIDGERLQNRDSWGLKGMYERSRHFGGDLQITGAPGKGTIVELRFPKECGNAR